MHAPTSDGEALLLRYHERYPGATTLALADARDERGRSSYQWLVDDVAAGAAQRIVDLGCGDGYLFEQLKTPERALTGVDMSVSELGAARRRLGDGATLVEARAVALPFADASFDAVVSHLALMLMERLDVVLAEVARILQPGGWCFAIVGLTDDGPVPPVLRVFRKTWLETMGRTPHAVPVIGDPRARSVDGLAAFFAASGFTEFAAERLIVRRPATAREVAEHYGLYYPSASLPDAERAAFVDNLTKALVELEREGEELAVVATLLHMRARRSSS